MISSILLAYSAVCFIVLIIFFIAEDLDTARLQREAADDAARRYPNPILETPPKQSVPMSLDTQRKLFPLQRPEKIRAALSEVRLRRPTLHKDRPS